MLVSVRHTRLCREKLLLEVCISGWNSTCHPYIGCTAVLFDIYTGMKVGINFMSSSENGSEIEQGIVKCNNCHPR